MEEKVDGQNMDKKRELWEEFRNRGYLNFASFGSIGGTTSVHDREALTGGHTKEDIKEWFLNPDEFIEDVNDQSRLYYISESIYYRTINYYTNLLLLDYVLVPTFFQFEDADLEKIMKSKEKVVEYCDAIINKPTLRKIIKAVLKDSCYYGYERKEGKQYYLQRLPNKYCREGAIVNGFPSIEFDFSYFDTNSERLELYDSEFQTKYNSYTNGTEDKWQMLEPDKSICIPMESEDYNFPALTSLFIDLADLESYYNYMKQATETDISKILIQKAPMNKETGEMLVDPSDILFFHNAIAEILEERYKVVSTPFEVESIKFTEGKSSDAGFTGLSDMKRKVLDGAGLSKAVLGDTDSATGLKYNHDVAVSFVFSIIEKIEAWVNYRLKSISTRKLGFKVKFLRTTGNTQEGIFKTMNTLLSIGGSLFATISAAGMNPDDYMALLQLENLMGVKDMLTLPQSIHTQSGSGEEKEAGRPEQDDIGDAGEITRDTDGNDR